MFENAYRNRRILVTGHTGFKGSWLSHWLLELGSSVAGLSIDIPTQPSNFETIELEHRLRHHAASITNLEQVQRILAEERPEIVFHLAAQPLIRRSYDQPRLTFDTNLGGTINVLEAIRRTPSVRAAVFITSDKCYENVEWEYGYRESDRLGGADPYSASKACAEIAFSAYARSFFNQADSPRIVTTRAGNVIGGGDWAAERIVPDCVRAWADRSPAVLRNPSATRPWQHVLEPLSGYLWLGAQLLLRSDEPPEGAFNFGPAADCSHSVLSLVSEMHKSWPGSTWTINETGNGAKKEAGLLKLNCDRALHHLDWRPTLSFEEGVAMTAQWYRRYYEKTHPMRAFAAEQIRSYERCANERGRRWAQR